MALPMRKAFWKFTFSSSLNFRTNFGPEIKQFCQGLSEKEIHRRIFSAIQPTGIPHLGNYFGAIQNWVKLQNDTNNSVIFSIADMHSITLPQNPEVLRQSIQDCVAVLLACGIDPERSILFQQSSVSNLKSFHNGKAPLKSFRVLAEKLGKYPSFSERVHQHVELAWILGCKTTMAQLGQFPQWKAKAGNDQKKECVGLFTYPVLQTADILLYKTTHVPVGSDQLPHLNLAQNQARIFNNNYGNFFPIPKAISGELSRVKSLTNPDAKMSKSEPNPKSRIELTDSKDDITKKFKKAMTDFTGAVTFDPVNRPGVSNLVAIHAAIKDVSPEEICQEAIGLQTAEYKYAVAEEVNSKIAPIRERIFELKGDPAYIENVLKIGAERASVIAEQTYKEVKKLVGLV